MLFFKADSRIVVAARLWDALSRQVRETVKVDLRAMSMMTTFSTHASMLESLDLRNSLDCIGEEVALRCIEPYRVLTPGSVNARS